MRPQRFANTKDHTPSFIFDPELSKSTPTSALSPRRESRVKMFSEKIRCTSTNNPDSVLPQNRKFVDPRKDRPQTSRSRKAKGKYAYNGSTQVFQKGEQKPHPRKYKGERLLKSSHFDKSGLAGARPSTAQVKTQRKIRWYNTSDIGIGPVAKPHATESNINTVATTSTNTTTTTTRSHTSRLSNPHVSSIDVGQSRERSSPRKCSVKRTEHTRDKLFIGKTHGDVLPITEKITRKVIKTIPTPTYSSSVFDFVKPENQAAPAQVRQLKANPRKTHSSSVAIFGTGHAIPQPQKVPELTGKWANY